MATVKEFKEWLNKFPDETIIEVGFQERGSQYESYGCVHFKELIPTDNLTGDGWEFMDLRGNPFVKPTEEYFDKCFLRLGESC